MARLISSDVADINKRLWRLRNRFVILDIFNRFKVLATKAPIDPDDYVTFPIGDYLDCYETGTKN